MEEKDALEKLRTTVLRVFPEHAASDFRLHAAGWDSYAVDVDDRLIFKFPRRAQADARLRNEAKLLSVVRPSITMPVPEIVLHEGRRFSRATRN